MSYASIVRAAFAVAVIGLGGCASRNSGPHGTGQSAEEKSQPAQSKTFSSSKASELYETALGVFTTHKYDKAVDAFKEALAVAEEEGDGSLTIRSLSMIARSWLAQGNSEEGRPWLNRASKLASPEDPQGWAAVLGVRGRFEWKAKEYAKAEATFTEMYEYCLEREMHRLAIDAAHMVALVGDVETKIEWALKAIKAAEAGGEETAGWLGPIWNNLGWTYDGMGEADKALEALLKARKHHYENGNDLSKVVADIFVGIAQRKAGKLEEAMETIKAAQARVEQLAGENPDNKEYIERKGDCRRELGEHALLAGEREAALEHFRAARDLLREAGAESWDREGFKKFEERIKQLEEPAEPIPPEEEFSYHPQG